MTQSIRAGVHSLLDTDLYKLTMQAAIIQHYPDTQVTYRFFNRNPSKSLNKEAVTWLQRQITKLANLRVSDDEIVFLKSHCSYLPDSYYPFLQHLQLDPDNEVSLQPDEKGLEINVRGLWKTTILYEIPLLSLISEAYFLFVDTDWSHAGQLEKAREKGTTLMKDGCAFAEFGTRRRRDYHTQDLVMQGLTEAMTALRGQDGIGALVGTSNVHFAQKYNLKPIGTVAHEWFMGTAAITKDYVQANKLALVRWRETFGDELGIALTDTFGTNAFLQNFTIELAQQYAGVRQDSGSPEAFAGRMVQFYQDRGIDPMTKSIVYSDGLNIDRCLSLQRLSTELGIRCSFGIGTFLTNDFKRMSDPQVSSTAMNIVIKLTSANGEPAIKISDEMGKHTGDKDLVKRVQEVLKQAERFAIS